LKTQSQTYIDKETGSTRKPLELYKIWSGSTYWYYTNGDVAVTYDGHSYEPAPIKRQSVSYDSTLDVTNLKIEFATITDPAVQYIAQNPIAITWIEVSRLFRDQDPYEKSVIFIGQIKKVAFKGLSALGDCVGFEHFLKVPVPAFRYQITCNHQVFDAKCQLVAATWKVSAQVTLDATKTILSSATFASYAGSYFTGGLVSFEGESRTVVANSSGTITLGFKMLNLEDNDVIDVYPGCNGRVTTCRDKFNNIVNFLGFPFIPDENPATRMP
jgi:uncharacterized phage protein (TIGR02218 family)